MTFLKLYADYLHHHLPKSPYTARYSAYRGGIYGICTKVESFHRLGEEDLYAAEPFGSEKEFLRKAA